MAPNISELAATSSDHRRQQSLERLLAHGVGAGWHVLTAHHALRAMLFFGVRGWLAVLLVLGGLVGGRDASMRRTFEARNLALALVIANMTVRDDQVLMRIFAAWVILFAPAAPPWR
jgi:hypothetical protein